LVRVRFEFVSSSRRGSRSLVRSFVEETRAEPSDGSASGFVGSIPKKTEGIESNRSLVADGSGRSRRRRIRAGSLSASSRDRSFCSFGTTHLGVHVRHEPGADLAGLLLSDVHLLDVELVRLLVLVALEDLADAHVHELVHGGGLGGLVRHGARGDARGGGGARGDAARRDRAKGRGGGDGVHGAEGEGHRVGGCVSRRRLGRSEGCGRSRAVSRTRRETDARGGETREASGSSEASSAGTRAPSKTSGATRGGRWRTRPPRFPEKDKWIDGCPSLWLPSDICRVSRAICSQRV